MSTNRAVPDPSTLIWPPYPGRYIFLVVLLTFASIALQVISFAAISIGLQYPRSGGRSSAIGTGNNSLLPHCAALHKGELWVSVATTPLPAVRRPGFVPPQSRLVVINPSDGATRDSGISLEPGATGVISVGDELWCISKWVMTRIVDEQAIPRRPIRALNEPSNPFLYHGELAVIDRNTNDDYDLLVWQNNEWSEAGRLDIPGMNATGAAWLFPQVRVLATSNSIYLFHSNGTSVRFREGLSFVSNSPAASAANPANSPLPELGSETDREAGWTPINQISNWGTVWDVVDVDGDIRIYYVPSLNHSIEQIRWQDNAWIHMPLSENLFTESLAGVGGTPAYLVSDFLHLYELGNSTLKRVAPFEPISPLLEWFLSVVPTFLSYALGVTMLTVGTSWLMRRYRSSGYLFGKRTVTQASVARRAIARGIDLLISTCPVFIGIGMSVPYLVEAEKLGMTDPIRSQLVELVFATFGIWFLGVIFLSFIQGLYGITPGKWLCGIRALRTTLRPPGLLRSLTRELLVYVDGFFFLTWIPGVLLIAFTPHWQRLGDLAADTVVILNLRPSSSETSGSEPAEVT
ncbi:RDD family protein [Schlesneria sp. T3-172]|uniref:RDD family protein n=1 Tax=Schlesneria sphaerica TaxID=3373610 RepID=UPI0037CC0609